MDIDDLDLEGDNDCYDIDIDSEFWEEQATIKEEYLQNWESQGNLNWIIQREKDVRNKYASDWEKVYEPMEKAWKEVNDLSKQSGIWLITAFCAGEHDRISEFPEDRQDTITKMFNLLKYIEKL